jgi:hypothetical protein
MNKLWLILSAVVFLAVIALSVILASSRSDQWYVQQFQKHRHELEELATLLQTNQIKSVMRRSDHQGLLLRTSAGGGLEAVSKSAPYGGTLRRLFDVIGCDYASRAEIETTILLPRLGRSSSWRLQGVCISGFSTGGCGRVH